LETKGISAERLVLTAGILSCRTTGGKWKCPRSPHLHLVTLPDRGRGEALNWRREINPGGVRRGRALCHRKQLRDLGKPNEAGNRLVGPAAGFRAHKSFPRCRIVLSGGAVKMLRPVRNLLTPCRQRGRVIDSTPPPTPYAQSRPGVSPSWQVYCDDAREVLLRMPAASIDCVVTSPPYYWQRDYGVRGQLGMEPTVQGFVDNLRAVFAGVFHVLRPAGVVFLNLGDTYYNAKGRPHGRDNKHAARHLARRQLRAVDGPGLGLPRKSLLGIPWRVALAGHCGLRSSGSSEERCRSRLPTIARGVSTSTCSSSRKGSVTISIATVWEAKRTCGRSGRNAAAAHAGCITPRTQKL
jgi:hypothetical protein